MKGVFLTSVYIRSYRVCAYKTPYPFSVLRLVPRAPTSAEDFGAPTEAACSGPV